METRLNPRPHSASYEVVWEFERQVAAFAGAKYGISTDSCTSALFLCCKLLKVGEVTLPAKTYVSVPAAVIHAGGAVKFEDVPWVGVYQLKPYPVWDAALRFKRGMYQGGFQCLSFQMKKGLPIGRGGMILTDNTEAIQWLRKARANGRDTSVPYSEDLIDMVGWNMAMTPEQGARGLQLLESLGDGLPDKQQHYPDLRKMPAFRS